MRRANGRVGGKSQVLRDIVKAFRRPIAFRRGAWLVRCPAPLRHALLAESLGKRSLWVNIKDLWYKPASLSFAVLVDKVGGTGPAGSCSLADTHGASAQGPALQSPMRPLNGATGLIQEPGVELKPGTAPRAAPPSPRPVCRYWERATGDEFRHVCPAMGTRRDNFLTWSAPRGMAIAPV